MTDANKPRPDKVEIYWENWRGKRVTREVHQTLDIRDFIGTAGYPLLVMAANPHLSASDITKWLYLKANTDGVDGVERPDSWVYKRRWLFQQPEEDRRYARPHQDGRDEYALRIVQENRTLSLRDIARALKERGIRRSLDWIRHNRVYASSA